MLIDEDLPVALPVGHDAWTARALPIGPDDDRVDIAAIETPGGLTIATHRKTGWRYRPSGDVMAQDLDLADTARQAVGNVLALQPGADSEAAARTAGERHLAETVRLGSLVHDPKVWPTRPISVDDVLFVLFVTTTDSGQAAVADLGPVRLAIWGSVIPEGLALRLAPLRSITFECAPRADLDE